MISSRHLSVAAKPTQSALKWGNCENLIANCLLRLYKEVRQFERASQNVIKAIYCCYYVPDKKYAWNPHRVLSASRITESKSRIAVRCCLASVNNGHVSLTRFTAKIKGSGLSKFHHLQCVGVCEWEGLGLDWGVGGVLWLFSSLDWHGALWEQLVFFRVVAASISTLSRRFSRLDSHRLWPQQMMMWTLVH